MHVAQAPGQFDHGRLSDQDGAHVFQMLDHRGVEVENLIGKGLGAPGRGDSADRQEIFGGVRNSVKGPAIVAAVNFFLGGLGLFEGNFRREHSESR